MIRHAKAFFAVLIASFGLGATAAFALQTHNPGAPFDGSQVPNGSFGNLGGVAVDQSGGDVYVVDTSGSAVDSSGAIQRFDSSGTYLSQLQGQATTEGNLALYSESDVAIDSSGTSSDGTAYVTDSFHNLMVAFDTSTGNLETAFDTDGELNGSATPAGSFSIPCGVAVDQTNGNVFVADQGNNRIWIFDNTGNYLDRIADSSLSSPCGLALTSTGDLFVRNSSGGKALRFNKATGTEYNFASTAYTPGSEPQATDVATNSADDHLYVDKGNRITEYDFGGSLVSTFGQATLSGSPAIAVNATNGTVYASSGSQLKTFGPLVTLPDPLTGLATDVTDTTATLKGTIDPAGGSDAECEFEYGANAYDFTAPCEPPGPYSSTTEVSAAISGLNPSTKYNFRLVGENANGVNEGKNATFATVGAPVLSSVSASATGTTSAVFKATINPAGFDTTYRFEYVGLAEFEASGFANATKTPVPDGEIAAGNTDMEVSQIISGLTANTAFRLRLIGTNSIGTTTSAIKGFNTLAVPDPQQGQFPGQGFLPDNRAWEMVSPVEKNGGYVVPMSPRTQAASDGSAVSFASLQGFADAAGSGAGFEYVARRSNNPIPGHQGWTTHATIPLQEPQTYLGNTFVLVPRYEGKFSDDLSTGVFHAWSSLTDNQWVGKTANLYLRDDLTTAGSGSYELLTECPYCEETEIPISGISKVDSQARLYLADTSSDFSRVFFETSLTLTSGTGSPLCLLITFFCPNSKLYEWHDGSVSLVGILPDGTPASRSSAGSSLRGPVPISWPALTGNPVSLDGHRVVFTVSDVASTTEGALYVRINGQSTVPINGSERTVPTTTEDAKFWDASADLSRIVFTSHESLTDNAPSALALNKAYMWELQDHSEVQEVKVDATGGSFTLTFNSQMTAPIPFDASPELVQSELEALSTVKVGNVEVAGGPGSAGGANPYSVKFVGDFTGTNVAELSASGGELAGGAASVDVTTATPVENLTYLNTDQEPGDDGSTSNNVRGVIGISEDGEYVYFVGESQIVADEPLRCGSNFRPCIFAWHDGEVSHVAALETSGSGNSTNEHLFYGVEVNSLFGKRKESRISPDGRHMIFWSGNSVRSADDKMNYEHETNGSIAGQIYSYSADSKELQCASCNRSASKTRAEAMVNTILASSGAIPTGTYVSHPLSDDGRYVFFSTEERLVAEDTNGVSDAYVFDTTTGKQHLLSSGESSEPSYFLDASADGRDAFFVTSESLSRWDVDRANDLYDARVGGGFPERPLPPLGCQGDACQPPPLVLNDPTPASAAFDGPGNRVERAKARRARCAKGRRKSRTGSGKARCQKAKRRKKAAAAQHPRGANGDRRASR